MKEILSKEHIGGLLQYWGANFSGQFVDCFNKQLSVYLEPKIGTKPQYDISLKMLHKHTEKKLEIMYGPISYFRAGLYVNYSILKVNYCWNSVSGKIYKTSDTDIDEADIRFWIEGWDDEKYKIAVSRRFTKLNDANGQHPFFETSWAALLRLDHDIEISDEFIICAGNQLAAVFEKETGISVTDQMRLAFGQEVVVNYQRGVESGMNAKIWLNYGQVQVRIVWRSVSGRIYELTDRDIDCADITFSLESVDRERCHKLMFPKWSLVTFPESALQSLEYKESTPVPVSLAFIICYDKKLSPIFESLTGFKINKDVSLSIDPNSELRQQFNYVKDTISRLAATLYINHNWNKLFICWKSKSGRIYDIGDTDIDCDDTEFWFEGFDVLLYNKQMFPKIDLPFKLKNLSYELVITRIHIDITIGMQLKPAALAGVNNLIETIDDFIDDYNTKSEKKDRKYGVVHNWTRNVQGNKLVYDIDTGFTGAYFLKKILIFLSAMNVFEKVEVL